MVCSANDLLGWKDFPKGLRVLLLDEDDSSAAEMKSKLEEMDYIVCLFHNENEAFSAIADKSERFHVAIVEINSDNGNGRFKFLESVKDLPTVMISDMHCLNTMMKCIALGAVEFLRKPLSEERLKNIWQHVAHKAFSAGGKGRSELLNPVKESVVPMLQPNESMNSIPVEEEVEFDKEKNREISAASDKYPAPSTPQLKQAVRSLDDGDCQDQSNFSIEKESMDKDGESKFVDTTCGSSGAETAVRLLSPAKRQGEAIIKEEDVSVDNSRGANNESPLPENKDCPGHISGNASELVKASGTHNSSGTKSNRKKMKVGWTTELHKKFVQAVEQLGVDQAIPSRILEHMKVDGLTRHNVASHLQKYRMHHRRILPKEEERRWPQARDSAPRSYYPLKPIMAFPPYQSNHALSTSQVYPAWGPLSNYPAGVQMWSPPYYHAWQSTENWHWKPSYSGMHADAWGCPVMPLQLGPHTSFPQNASGFPNADMIQSSCSMSQKSFDFHTSEEVIDEVVKEAISKPWLPLPLGLKPPSIDGVLNELSKQGISTIPPHINSSCHL